MNKILMIAGLIVIVGVAVWVVVPKKQAQNNTVADNNTATLPPPPISPQPTPTPATINPPPPPPVAQPTPPPASKPTPPPVVKTPTPPPAKTFIIEIDDYSATPASIEVSKGGPVKLVVKAKSTNVYYGGIELKSSVLNTGTVAAGTSKTVEFTADSSFDFIPYWPASGVKKDYKFSVIVK